MSRLLEQLTRNITTTEVWLGVLVFFLLGVGLRLLGYSLGFTINFDGWIPQVERIPNANPGPRSLRVVWALIGIGLCIPGLIGLYRLTSVTTLEVLTSLSEEEYAQFQELEVMFHEKYEGEKLRIRSENVNWPDLIRRLKQERIDVIIFDVTRRLELLREDLLKPLDDHRLFIPSSIYPTLLDNVNFNKSLYFLPYRPNVRIGWWNSHHPTVRDYVSKGPACAYASMSKPPGFPKTWQDVKKFAACSRPKSGTDDRSKEISGTDDRSKEILDRYGVVLSAKGAKWRDGDEIDLRSPPLDAAILLLEVLMASGKEPWELCESWAENKEDSPLKVLRDIYNVASPRSSDTDWQTATGHLLSGHVALARNWSFSIAAMRDSGELQTFHPYVAWEWVGANNTRLRTLLGGDAIALPRYGRDGDEVDKLLRFLISKDAQRIFVEDLTWPPMRLDVKGEKDAQVNKPRDEKDKDKKEPKKPRAVDPCPDTEVPIMDAKCHGDSPPTGKNATKCECLHLNLAHVAVRKAMQHAEPPPMYWSPEMHKSFTSAFQALVSPKGDVASELVKAAGQYCLAPEGKTSKDKQEKQGKKKLDGYITLRFEGDPNTALNKVLPEWLLNTALNKVLPEWEWLLNTAFLDTLDTPRIRVKLVKAEVPPAEVPPAEVPPAEVPPTKVPPTKVPPAAASYHTGLCVQLYSDNDNTFLDPIKIPAGFTSKLNELLPAPLFFSAVNIKKGEAWELKDADAKCEPKKEAVLLYENPLPLTVVALPFTLFAFLVLGALIGRFFGFGRQRKLLKQLQKAVRSQFTVTRGLLVLLFLLIVPPIWFTLERLEYAKEVRQFFSDVPVQAWLIPLVLFLGFVLEMVGEKVVSWLREAWSQQF